MLRATHPCSHTAAYLPPAVQFVLDIYLPFWLVTNAGSFHALPHLAALRTWLRFCLVLGFCLRCHRTRLSVTHCVLGCVGFCRAAPRGLTLPRLLRIWFADPPSLHPTHCLRIAHIGSACVRSRFLYRALGSLPAACLPFRPADLPSCLVHNMPTGYNTLRPCLVRLRCSHLTFYAVYSTLPSWFIPWRLPAHTACVRLHPLYLPCRAFLLRFCGLCHSFFSAALRLVLPTAHFLDSLPNTAPCCDTRQHRDTSLLRLPYATPWFTPVVQHLRFMVSAGWLTYLRFRLPFNVYYALLRLPGWIMGSYY